MSNNFEYMNRWAYFYRESPHCIPLYRDLDTQILEKIQSAHQEYDYDWFRRRYGPILIPIPKGGFFDEVITKIMEAGLLHNCGPCDCETDVKDMKIDLLEIMECLQSAIDYYDQERQRSGISAEDDFLNQ